MTLAESNKKARTEFIVYLNPMKKFLAYCNIMLLTVLAAGCSTANNTRGSRFYQATITKFNAWFNGNEAYKEGVEAQETSLKDNYLDILTMYPISDEDARKSGSSNFDLAIEKAEKCIKLHSITAKPKRKPGKTLTDEEKAWLNKNEYNPYLWHAWLLLADAQMQKGEFLEAAGTYSYIEKLYFDEPEVIAIVRMKTAQCYSELGWNYEADELLNRMTYDSIPVKQKAQYAGIKASHLIKQQRYREAIPLLAQSIDGTKQGKTQKIRQTFLLGQLYKETDNNVAAYRTFKKVIRMNPPYRTEFSARIQMTETMSGTGGAAAMEKKLLRMARDPNNKDYLDQVYYALGNTWISRGDTLKALEYYETGLEEGTGQGGERGILLLTMATLYWERAEYADAQRCYSEAVGLIERSNEQYDLVLLRSQVLEGLVKYSEEIQLQDSLQHLATLPESELLPIIDKIIEDLIEAEAEAEREAQEAEREAEKAADRAAATTVAENDGSWYFYNPALVKEGVAAFKKTWGNRKLEDNWRRKDRSVQESMQSSESPVETDGIPADSLSLDTESDSLSIDAGTEEVQASTDPHTREYYLQAIPYTDEQKRESDSLLADALLNAGIIYKDELLEYGLAENSLKRSAYSYPEFPTADDALYHLFLMYSLWDKPDLADMSRDSLKANYPESELTLTICNPYFEENARYGKHREDSLYTVAYQAWTEGDSVTVKEACALSEERYPTGAHRAKFIFLDAAVKLQNGDVQGFLEGLKTIVEKYSENEISALADIISKGVQSGKLLQSASFTTLWDRTNGEVLSDSAAAARPEFNADRYQPFLIVMAYPEDSLDENQLLFETARYNFSNYMIRNFDLSFRNEQGIGLFIIKEFLNFDEAYLYRKRLFDSKQMAARLDGIKVLAITEQNLGLLLQYYSFNEYQEFYERNFMDIPEFEIDGSTIDEEMPEEEKTEAETDTITDNESDGQITLGR